MGGSSVVNHTNFKLWHMKLPPPQFMYWRLHLPLGALFWKVFGTLRSRNWLKEAGLWEYVLEGFILFQVPVVTFSTSCQPCSEPFLCSITLCHIKDSKVLEPKTKASKTVNPKKWVLPPRCLYEALCQSCGRLTQSPQQTPFLLKFLYIEIICRLSSA